MLTLVRQQYHYMSIIRTETTVHEITSTQQTLQEKWNLQTNVAGVPNPGDPRDQEYTYVGIVGYVFLEDLGQGNRKTLETKES